MKAPLFGRIAILGAGLIGGSLAAAITKGNIALHVAAFDSNASGLDYLLSKGFAHSVHSDVASAVNGADIIVLAVPPDTLGALATSVAAATLKEGCIVTDVASIKRQAVASIAPCLPSHIHFVPGHPIAGGEKSGARAADAHLFEGKRVILTPTEDEVLSEAVAQVRNLWEATGAKVEYMPPELHDRIYAYVSHLPQITAFAAGPSVKDAPANTACVGVQRLAVSNPLLWADICFANADFIREALDEFSTFLTQMCHELLEDTEEKAGEVVENAPALLCAVLALCLVATTLLLEQRTSVPVGSYGGNGFKDMTAAAGNQSDSVLAAISSHPKTVAALLQTTLDRLNIVGAALSTGNRETLQKAFAA